MNASTIPIPAILEISPDALSRLGAILKKHAFTSAVILFDDFTYGEFKEKTAASLSSPNIQCVKMSDSLDIHALISLAFEWKQYELVISVGGGKVVDYGKYIAFSRKSLFISIPTAPSNDGFASSNCSLIVDGKKNDRPC